MKNQQILFLHLKYDQIKPKHYYSFNRYAPLFTACAEVSNSLLIFILSFLKHSTVQKNLPSNIQLVSVSSEACAETSIKISERRHPVTARKKCYHLCVNLSHVGGQVYWHVDDHPGPFFPCTHRLEFHMHQSAAGPGTCLICREEGAESLLTSK